MSDIFVKIKIFETFENILKNLISSSDFCQLDIVTFVIRSLSLILLSVFLAGRGGADSAPYVAHRDSVRKKEHRRATSPQTGYFI